MGRDNITTTIPFNKHIRIWFTQMKSTALDVVELTVRERKTCGVVVMSVINTGSTTAVLGINEDQVYVDTSLVH